MSEANGSKGMPTLQNYAMLMMLGKSTKSLENIMSYMVSVLALLWEMEE